MYVSALQRNECNVPRPQHLATYLQYTTYNYLIDRVDISVAQMVPVPDPEPEPQKSGRSESNEQTYRNITLHFRQRARREREREMAQNDSSTVDRARARRCLCPIKRSESRSKLDRPGMTRSFRESRRGGSRVASLVGRSPVGASWLAADPSPPQSQDGPGAATDDAGKEEGGREETDRPTRR